MGTKVTHSEPKVGIVHSFQLGTWTLTCTPLFISQLERVPCCEGILCVEKDSVRACWNLEPLVVIRACHQLWMGNFRMIFLICPLSGDTNLGTEHDLNNKRLGWADWVRGFHYVHLKIKSHDRNLGGDFKYFFMFNPTWGNDPIWRAYFSSDSSGWFNHQLEIHWFPTKITHFWGSQLDVKHPLPWGGFTVRSWDGQVIGLASPNWILPSKEVARQIQYKRNLTSFSDLSQKTTKKKTHWFGMNLDLRLQLLWRLFLWAHLTKCQIFRHGPRSLGGSASQWWNLALFVQSGEIEKWPVRPPWSQKPWLLDEKWIWMRSVMNSICAFQRFGSKWFAYVYI